MSVNSTDVAVPGATSDGRCFACGFYPPADPAPAGRRTKIFNVVKAVAFWTGTVGLALLASIGAVVVLGFAGLWWTSR